MKDRSIRSVTLAFSVVVVALAPDPARSSESPRTVLVEISSAHGCAACRASSSLLGELAGLGYGPDRVVPVDLHAPTTPHRHDGPRAESAMKIDGLAPVVAPDRDGFRAALDRALAERAGASIALGLEGDGPRKTLSVRIAAVSPDLAGRDLTVGVALIEDPATPHASHRDAAGHSRVERHVARSFNRRAIRLEGETGLSLTFPRTLPRGGSAERFRVAVFVRDGEDGKVHQTESIPWPRPEPAMSAARLADLRDVVARRSARRARSANDAWWPSFPSPDGAETASGLPPVCPDCGVPLDPRSLYRLGLRISTLPTTPC